MTVDEPAALAGRLAGARRTRPRGARAMVGGVMGPPSSPWGGSPEPCADGCGVEFECCEDAGKPAASPDPLRRRAALQDTRCCRRLRAWTRGWGSATCARSSDPIISAGGRHSFLLNAATAREPCGGRRPRWRLLRVILYETSGVQTRCAREDGIVRYPRVSTLPLRVSRPRGTVGVDDGPQLRPLWQGLQQRRRTL